MRAAPVGKRLLGSHVATSGNVTDEVWKEYFNLKPPDFSWWSVHSQARTIMLAADKGDAGATKKPTSRPPCPLP